MKIRKHLILSALGLWVLSNVSMDVAAQTAPINIVTTAVPFLRISPDARAGGMGDVGIASAPDANNSFWNVAKTPFATQRSALGITYTPWLKDIASDVFLATLAGYHQIDEEQAVSGGLRYFSLGNIQFVDFNGNPLGANNPREFALDAGYSRKLSEYVGIGVSLRYINSNLANGSFNGVTYKAGQTVSADLSVFGDKRDEYGKGMTWGVSLSNLGGKIGYTDNAQAKDYIPANLGVGLGYTWTFEEIHKLALMADVNKLLVPSVPVSTGDPAQDSSNLAEYRTGSVFGSWFKAFGNSAMAFSVGTEYTYNDQFAVRAGFYKNTKEMGNQSYFTAGVGASYNLMTFNFSYLAPSGSGITRNPLSNTLRFGLLINLVPQDEY
jgi:hypothetical protein